ncbi:MAG: 4Fe-4S binding protein [Chloroflexi bacterium]|nr:4Fe-4S binding protein [Chloroflexota bacterium]
MESSLRRLSAHVEAERTRAAREESGVLRQTWMGLRAGPVTRGLNETAAASALEKSLAAVEGTAGGEIAGSSLKAMNTSLTRLKEEMGRTVAVDRLRLLLTAGALVVVCLFSVQAVRGLSSRLKLKEKISGVTTMAIGSNVSTVARPLLVAVPAGKTKTDLLNIPILRRLLLSRYMPLSIQVLAIFGLAWVVYDGLSGSEAAGENFATLGVWSLFFWPVVLTSQVFLGRAWCGVCPLGALTAAAGGWSLNWPFPRGLRTTGVSLLFFMVVLWTLRPVMGLSESSAFTAWFFIVWSAIAVAVGLVFVARAFWQYVCPIAAPLSVLGRVAPVALRAGVNGRLNPVCSRCQGHECFKGSAMVGPCPAGEFPVAMDSNSRCLLCLKCLKSCPSPGQLQFRLRWPFSELVHERKPLLVDGVIVVALSSIVLWHMTMGHEPRMPQVFKVWGNNLHQFVPAMDHHAVEYLLTLSCAVAAMGSLFAVMSYVIARIARLSFRKYLAVSSYAFVALVVFRSLGYTTAGVISGGGDFLNYMGSLFGVHMFYPPALVTSVFRPLIPGTSYSLFALLLTAPILLGLLVTWFLAYRTWRSRSPRGRALLTALPAGTAAAIIVAVYEYFYLVGYKVIV